ncbi:hypothetical protein [Stakelama marina]|uniref:Alpha/beta hydrolase n=1 Tax=Stakelama marina TaxID=2826939 RepID=A0A8T4IBK3_9SPHN|nr:hypothetical protein [Stakelama marina]MBR0551940.1 hypothetical protein [Stakelama marina]
MIDHYDWPGGREAMLRFGPADGPVVVMLLPLFEEANRTRCFAVTLLRLLAARGIGGMLPDLPGQGESEISVEDTSLSFWNDAVSSACEAAGQDRYLATVRSGALLDGEPVAKGCWRFAPQQGDQLLHELGRTARVAAAEGGQPIDLNDIDLPGPPMEIAGNRLPRAMLRDIRLARIGGPAPTRTVRLASDPQPADRHVEGTPLWRRAEPDNDAALAALLATDLADWVQSCEG